ncbi:MAG TPA: SLC13 family permease [Candidatus Fermentibacter sp.]|nr:SLC13 family permease [Candidatus Fermentibacter sp.]
MRRSGPSRIYRHRHGPNRRYGLTAAAIAVFALTYVLIAARELSFIPIGRPAGALLGALLMVALGVMTPEQSFRAVDCSTILLLFSMMLLSAYLEDAGVLDVLARRATACAGSPRILLAMTSVSAAALSALLVNDTVCVFMTPFVLSAARRCGLDPGPYLIALATGANIGSAATLVGNPQNMIIGSMSGYGFSEYLWRSLPAVLAALAVNIVLLVLFFGKRVSARIAPPEPADQIRASGRGRPVEYAVLAAIAAGFFAGLHMGYTALAGVLVIMVSRRRNPADVFERVDWTLLVFFAALFMVVAGLNGTGVVARAWAAAAPSMDFVSAGGLALFTAFVTLGSNLVSNVPMTLLTGPHLASLGDPATGWVLLGFVTTIAGNLTLVGSVANIIVAERAKGAYDLGYVEYLKFGAVSTILSLAAGVPLICM